MSDYKENLTKLAKGGSMTGAGDLFSVASRMIAGVFVTHLLPSSGEFGMFDLAFKLCFFLRILALPGTNAGLNRYIPRYVADGDRASLKGILVYSLRVTTVMSVVTVVPLLLFSEWIAELFNTPGAAPYIRALSWTIPCYAFLFIFVSALTSVHKVKQQAYIAKILQPGLRALILLAFIPVASVQLRIFAVSWSVSISFGVAAAVALYYFLGTFKVLRDRTVKPKMEKGRFIKFSITVAAYQPLSYLMNYLGTFIIAIYVTETQVGEYGMVTRLTPLMIIPLQSAIIVFVPMISELHHMGRMDELARHFKFVSKWIFAASLFIFLCFLVMTKPLVALFGKNYTLPRVQLALITVGFAQLINAATGPGGMIIAMTGRPRVNLYNTILLLLANLGFSLLLIPIDGPYGGIVGAGIAQAIAIIGYQILFVAQTLRYLKMHPFSWGYLKPAVAGIISGLILYGGLRITGIQEYWRDYDPEGLAQSLFLAIQFVALSGVLAALYGGIIYLLGLDGEDKLILDKVISRFRRKRKGPENVE